MIIEAKYNPIMMRVYEEATGKPMPQPKK